MRNPRIFHPYIPEDITTSNVEETLMAQNPDLNLANGDNNAKFIYVTKSTLGT